MKDFLKSVALTGIGLASITKDKVVELGKKLAEEAKLTEEEGKKFIEELQEKAIDEKNKLEETIKTEIKKALEKLDVPTKADFDDLKARIEELEKMINSNKEECCDSNCGCGC